jgi:hypothetical protein
MISIGGVFNSSMSPLTIPSVTVNTGFLVQLNP